MNSVKLVLRQPAQLGDRARSDSLRSTFGHIPGAVLRGALAAAWIARYGEPTSASARRPEFIELFEGGVRYGPLFADSPPLPLSMVRHKYEPSTHCGDLYFDELTTQVSRSCPDCQSPLERATSTQDYGITVRRRTSVAVSAHGVAERGRLFSMDRLAPRDESGSSTEFKGHLNACRAELLGALKELTPIRIGGRRTTHGLADLSIDKPVNIDLPEALDERRVVLRLRSPGILVDECGRPSNAPSESELGAIVGSPVRVEQRWARWVSVGGWHIASGLPKPNEIAVAAGSTYVIRAEAPISDEKLVELASRGVGLRRHEGFGELGGRPRLPEGRIGREREAERVRNLADRVRPLLGVTTDQNEWPRFAGMLVRYAEGEPEAATALRTYGARLRDERIKHALKQLLTYPQSDVAAVLRELGVQT